MTDAELIELRLQCFDRFSKGWTRTEEGQKPRAMVLDEIFECADELAAWTLCGSEPSEVRTMIDGDL